MTALAACLAPAVHDESQGHAGCVTAVQDMFQRRLLNTESSPVDAFCQPQGLCNFASEAAQVGGDVQRVTTWALHSAIPKAQPDHARD
jgi:hypothetical protein